MMGFNINLIHSKCRLLKLEEIFEKKISFSKKTLNVIKQAGKEASITDFYIVLGGEVSDYTINNSSNLNDRAGFYWTELEQNSSAYAVTNTGTKKSYSENSMHIGVRPTLPYSSIQSFSENKIIENGIVKIQYGDYPQDVVISSKREVLENLYKSQQLNKTGSRFLVNKQRFFTKSYLKYGIHFIPEILEEYEFEGQKFVRVAARPKGDKQFVLSDGKQYNSGDAIWIEVKPINWIVDEEKDIAVSEKILLAGIPIFVDKDLNMQTFLDYNFSPQIIQNKNFVKQEEENINKSL